MEAVVNGHPDVEVNLGLADVVVGQSAAQARGVLLQHVSVILPSPTLRKNLQRIKLHRYSVVRKEVDSQQICCYVQCGPKV